MSRHPPCPLQHVDPNKIQVDVAVWSQMQSAATEALAAQRDIADKIAQAVAAERAAMQTLRSDDVTSLQSGNRILREHLAAINEDMRDRDKRILELLTRVDVLQKENAQLKGERADMTLVNNREQRSLEMARAQLQSSDQRFQAVMGQISPLIPLLARVGVAAAASKVPGAMPPSPSAAACATEPTPSPSAAADASPSASAAAEPEVIQSVMWTQNRIEEWKAALCDFIMSSSPSSAAAFRFYICETNLVALLGAPPESLPDMVRDLVVDAGPEIVRRLQILTAAARPT
jgi:hypothetical protein